MSRPSRVRSPALSWVTRSMRSSHSGVAYSGCEPTSRYSRAPFFRKTLLLRPQETTRRKRYRATSSGLNRRWPRNVHVTPYSFSRPKIRRSIGSAYADRTSWGGTRNDVRFASLLGRQGEPSEEAAHHDPSQPTWPFEQAPPAHPHRRRGPR